MLQERPEEGGRDGILLPPAFRNQGRTLSTAHFDILPTVC